MNQIKKSPLNTLGYNFIPPEYLPEGKDEYYLRNKQNNNGINYRQLTAGETEVLVRNRNTSDNWNRILVSDSCNPELVQDCKFYGLVRIGKLEPHYLEFNNLRRPVGLYNSTIISCDFGDNVVIDNVNYISHYIVGSEVIIINVNELAITDHARFGNGILKEGEPENIRIWLEVCNENGGRKILPFDGMLPGDAFLWSRWRDNELLQKRFKEFTEKKFDTLRGYYGVIGDRTVIKNCKIIKDVNIGTDAYLKGANKLKNLTINSSSRAKSQVGEGCELVNGIVDFGCRIFYGVKAVRFFMASNSQLKYGARLINSYLGDNSTISCCEVLNSLIFPAHEQHHNNSFLCAALIQGQSNMAAGATIGSNHNSRSADGEMITGRGFWPGLCVSLKHNSRFASFSILAKGDYPAELNIPIPFSLINNDVAHDRLEIMPGYWFLYNMYALARNSWKYIDRDKRVNKTQQIEVNFLAPDTINEMITSLSLFAKYTGEAYLKNNDGKRKTSELDFITSGYRLLEGQDPLINELELTAVGFENSNRQVRLSKVLSCYNIFKELISHHLVQQLVEFISGKDIDSVADLQANLPTELKLTEWVNVGGQLMVKEEIDNLLQEITTATITSWEEVHAFYLKQGQLYKEKKFAHALAAFHQVYDINVKKAIPSVIKKLLEQSITTGEWMVKAIYDSRAKDYSNPFRKMAYQNQEEMNAVLGKLDDNSFIKQEMESLAAYKNAINNILKRFSHAREKRTVQQKSG